MRIEDIDTDLGNQILRSLLAEGWIKIGWDNWTEWQFNGPEASINYLATSMPMRIGR